MASRRLRVLMLLENHWYPDDLRVHREALALRDAGYQVSIIAPRGRGERLFETVDGMRAYRYWNLPTGSGAIGYLIEYSWALVSMLTLSLVVAAREGFDVVHAHNPPD